MSLVFSGARARIWGGQSGIETSCTARSKMDNADHHTTEGVSKIMAKKIGGAWFLATGRIADGETRPGRLVERVKFKRAIDMDEGATFQHPRLGHGQLFTDKYSLAETALKYFNTYRVNKYDFMKQYGHWYDTTKARARLTTKPNPRYVVNWPPSPFTLSQAMQVAPVGMTEQKAAQKVYQKIKAAPVGTLPYGFAAAFMRLYGKHL